jgi:hypothetical protein
MYLYLTAVCKVSQKLFAALPIPVCWQVQNLLKIRYVLRTLDDATQETPPSIRRVSVTHGQILSQKVTEIDVAQSRQWLVFVDLVDLVAKLWVVGRIDDMLDDMLRDGAASL